MFCSNCKNGTFKLFENPYSVRVYPKTHWEIVCVKCGLGCPIEARIIMDINGRVL